MNKECEHCNSKDSKMFIFKFISGTNKERAVFINKDNELEMAICDEKWETEDTCRINYCPICGRKLDSEIKQ